MRVIAVRRSCIKACETPTATGSSGLIQIAAPKFKGFSYTVEEGVALSKRSNIEVQGLEPLQLPGQQSRR